MQGKKTHLALSPLIFIVISLWFPSMKEKQSPGLALAGACGGRWGLGEKSKARVSLSCLPGGLSAWGSSGPQLPPQTSSVRGRSWVGLAEGGAREGQAWAKGAEPNPVGRVLQDGRDLSQTGSLPHRTC